MTSIIESLKTFILTYNGLEATAPVNVNFLEKQIPGYSIVPMPGNKMVEEYVDGGSTREYPFAIQIAVSTADDVVRIDSNVDVEAFAAWLETQTLAGTLPTLASGKTAEKIEAVNWGYLFEQGESQTGVYQIECRLTYKQDA